MRKMRKMGNWGIGGNRGKWGKWEMGENEMMLEEITAHPIEKGKIHSNFQYKKYCRRIIFDIREMTRIPPFPPSYSL